MLDQGHEAGLTLTIKGVRSHKMDDGKTQRVLSFHEDERELGLNQTNWDAVADITGKNDDDDWIGRKVHVYPHKLDRPFQGYTHGMRVRAPGATNGKATKAQVWTWAEATQHAVAVGITQPELVERLKAAGLKGYNAERDTGTVQAIIAEATESGFESLPSAEEEVETPFDSARR